MWTHVAALTGLEDFPLAVGESAGDCEAADLAAGLGDLPALCAAGELQAAISTAPLQLSVTIASHARPAGRLDASDLVIDSSVMLQRHTLRLPDPPHPERAMRSTGAAQPNEDNVW